MNKGVEYEQITRLIFQTLVDQDEARNIDVQHDVILPGKFLAHQVDVYWEVEIGGVKHRTVIECKDWNRPLEQEKLLAFRSKLEDLNSPVGVMVTRSGYQSGALKYANKHGIYLYQLFEEPPRAPLVMTEGSFAIIKLVVRANEDSPHTPLWTMCSEYTYYEPKYSDNRYELDPDWFQEQVRRIGEHVRLELQQFKLPVQPLSVTKLYDETSNEIGSVLGVFKKKSKEMFEGEVTRDKFVHMFSEPTFLKTNLESLPYLKINAMSTNITIIRHEPILRAMKTKGFVNYILRRLQDGTERIMIIKENLNPDEHEIPKRNA